MQLMMKNHKRRKYHQKN